jgi:ribosomal protein S18 acetylase RimI-like enzyme
VNGPPATSLSMAPIADADVAAITAQGIEKLQLMVRPDNKQVQAFYDALGYDEQERVVYAKWLDGREPTP